MYFLTKVLSTVTFFFLLSLALSGTPLPQEDAPEKSAVEDDLAFAVDLARNRYFDLANDYMELVKKGRLSDQEKDYLILTNASILKLASEHATEESERMEFYNQAITLFKQFIDYNTHHEEYEAKCLDLAEVHINLGKFLSNKLKRTEDPTERKQFIEEAQETFRAGVQLYNDTARLLRDKAENYESLGDLELAKFYADMARNSDYKKGIAYYSWALIYPKEEFNREDYLERAINTLDDYIWDSSEDDFYVLWAYLYQAMAYLEQGLLEDALDLAKQVYDPITGIDLDQAVDLEPEYARLITDLVETAYLQVARIYYQQEKYNEVDATVNDLQEQFSSRNFELTFLGDTARLEQARALLELNTADATDKAAMICKEVADKNPSNMVGWESKIMLKNIIERPSNTNISPDVLFSAADGSRAEKKLVEAINGYMRVLRSSKTVQQKNEFNAKCWYCIGRCYMDMTRYLEAAIAFENGFTDPDRGKDNVMYTSNAQNWYKALSRRNKETRDTFDDKRMRQARDLLVGLNISTDLVFLIAEEKFAKATAVGQDPKVKEEMLNDALEEYKNMDKQSKLYERSLVYVGRCYFELGQYDDAVKAMADFKKYVDRAAPPGTADQRKNRTIALAQHSFWLTEIYLKQDKFDEALKALEGFEDLYSTQAGFFPGVLYNRLLAKLRKGDFKTAEAFFKDLQKTYPDSGRTPSAAYYIALTAKDKAKEFEAPEGQEPTAKHKEMLRKAADYMFIYCELSEFDSFTNLENVCTWYRKLGEMGDDKCLEISRNIYEKLLKEFGGKDSEYLEEIESSVYRGYGEVLLAQRDFEKARPIWLKLLAANTKSVQVLRSTAFCLGGWLEPDGATFMEIPGAGVYAPDPATDATGKINLNSAQGIWSYLLKGIEDRGEKYGPDWWEAKFYATYMRYKAGEQFPAYYDMVLKLIDNQKLFQEEMGGPDWRRKFNYIEKAVKSKKRGE